MHRKITSALPRRLRLALLPRPPAGRLGQIPPRGPMIRLKSLSLVMKAAAFFCALVLTYSLAVRAAESEAKPAHQQSVLTGQQAFTDAAHESPGIRRHLTAADLPAPAPEQSVDNGPTLVPRPGNAWLIAPKGFKVELYAADLDNPRLIRFAPNGDLFLAESATGKIKIL